jgi:hypothetical protein
MAAADHQTMFKKVQDTDYHTSEQEQREVESIGWDINFTQADFDKHMAQIEVEAEPVKEQLTRRANNGELSESEATRQYRKFFAERYEEKLRQMMALYDMWKRQHFPKIVGGLYRMSVSIDGAQQSLINQRRDLGL